MARLIFGLVCVVPGGLYWLARRKGPEPDRNIDDEMLQPPPFAGGGKENDAGASGGLEGSLHRHRRSEGSRRPLAQLEP
ncbi:hypothetical protein BSKO_11962 [Bryopsis sp. KO-2023]|nr:hypothetical protein BSKO_11962 [Bryopsis sp. KO-2023]